MGTQSDRGKNITDLTSNFIVLYRLRILRNCDHTNKQVHRKSCIICNTTSTMSNHESGAIANRPDPARTIQAQSNPVKNGSRLTELNLWQLRKESRRKEAKRRGWSTPSTGSDEMPLDPVAWLRTRPKADTEMERVAQQDSMRYNERLAELERTGNTDGAIRVGNKWIFLDNTGRAKRQRSGDDEEDSFVDSQEPRADERSAAMFDDHQVGDDVQHVRPEYDEIDGGARGLRGLSHKDTDTPISRDPKDKSLFTWSNEDQRPSKRQKIGNGSPFGSSEPPHSRFSTTPLFKETRPLFYHDNTTDKQEELDIVAASGGLSGPHPDGLSGDNAMNPTSQQQATKSSLLNPVPPRRNDATETFATLPSTRERQVPVKSTTAGSGLLGLSKMPTAPFPHSSEPIQKSRTPTTAVQSQQSQSGLFASFYRPDPATSAPPSRNLRLGPQALFAKPPQAGTNHNPESKSSLEDTSKHSSIDTKLERAVEPRNANDITHPLNEEPLLDLETHLPANFPRYYTPKGAGHLNETGLYLSRARYIISLAGPPLSDMTYGIIVVPFGEEELVLCGHSRSCDVDVGPGDGDGDQVADGSDDIDMQASRRLRDLVEDSQATRPEGLGNLSWEGQGGASLASSDSVNGQHGH
ncbi:hypothetical protein V8F20_012061 [Naviculisporaceae sp. PSN 640]